MLALDMRLWTEAERTWAAECFAAGDSLAEIADVAGRTVFDVAVSLRLYGFVPRDRRWQASRINEHPGLAPKRWVGGMLKEVAMLRFRRGESVDGLAAEAEVKLSAMYAALKRIRQGAVIASGVC
jgi:hypothetical protein